MFDLVGNTEERFCRDAPHLAMNCQTKIYLNTWMDVSKYVIDDFDDMFLDRGRFHECIFSIGSLLRGQLAKFMLIM